MKSISFALGLLLVAGIASAETFKVNTKESRIEWTGKKVTGQHNGTIDIKKGEVEVKDGRLAGGQFVIDMTSIKNLDLKGDSNAKLTGHLKSDDFFGVETHPTAKFVITNVKDSVVTGNLTIKGKTHPLSFPAEIEIHDKGVMAAAQDVKVDRTLYDVRYGSDKFFDNLGDKVIYDNFLLNIHLVAGK